jgi:hypothetical protein
LKLKRDGPLSHVAFNFNLRRYTKRRAIAAMGMGTENKVIMRFESMFWPVKTRFFQCTDQRFR